MLQDKNTLCKACNAGRNAPFCGMFLQLLFFEKFKFSAAIERYAIQFSYLRGDFVKDTIYEFKNDTSLVLAVYKGTGNM